MRRPTPARGKISAAVGTKSRTETPTIRISLLGSRMSTHSFVGGGYEIDSSPSILPDGRFAARALVTRLTDRHATELLPDFEPFPTEAEASSAGHMAAVAWVVHQGGAT
jgi:hypothetical protein